jgi:hypothetical protein
MVVVFYGWHHPSVAGTAVAQLLCRTLLPNPVPSQKMSEGLLPWAVLSRTVLFVGSAPLVDLVEMPRPSAGGLWEHSTDLLLLYSSGRFPGRVWEDGYPSERDLPP